MANALALHNTHSWSLGCKIGQCRVIPIRIGTSKNGAFDAIAVAHTANVGSNPYYEMFSFPNDTLKLAVFAMDGRRLWERDLGPGVVADFNFIPFAALDLDGDGVDELFFVNNVDPIHPLAHSQYRLERVDPRTGETMAQQPWPKRNAGDNMVDAFRNVITTAYVRGQPVLITTQGLYTNMYLQAWNPDLSTRWEIEIRADQPGARGSHMFPVVDLNHDGVDELMWGERCIELDTGRELFCADQDSYSGHSDIILPFLNHETDEWRIYTAREKQNTVGPRVAVYDASGQRLWGAIDHGHMHIGWVARLERDRLTAMAIRIGGHVQTRAGRKLLAPETFAFDAVTGESRDLAFDPYNTLPVDLNGDGVHELVRGTPRDPLPNGDVIDGEGNVLGNLGGPLAVALASKIIDHPGEQVLTYTQDGMLRLWADANAVDSPAALRRYQHPHYKHQQRRTGCGNFLPILGGI